MAKGTCSVDACDRPVKARGWCNAHWLRWWKYGDPLRTMGTPYNLTEAERFWPKVDRQGPDECWPWLAVRDSWGYGQFSRRGVSIGAHRVAYELAVGPIPEGMTIDHLCRNRACCNPAHMEPVTMAENLRRAHPRKTHCKRGHEFTPENTCLDRNGGRRCRTCHNASVRRRYVAIREGVREHGVEWLLGDQ